MTPRTILQSLLKAQLDPRLSPILYTEFRENPITIYDIGAAGGVYTPFTVGPTEWAPVVGFEPHPESYQKVAKLEGGVPKKRTGDHFWRPEAQDGHQEVTMVEF